MNKTVGIKQELLLSRLGDDEAARLVMTVLTTARRIDAACAELLSRHDLSEGRLAALLAVSAEPGITPRVLGDRLEVTSATVTGLLDRLDRDGLIERQPHSTDRRTHTLTTTSAGEQLISDSCRSMLTGSASSGLESALPSVAVQPWCWRRCSRILLPWSWGE